MMRTFLLQLLLCSAGMSAVTLVYWLLSRGLGRTWSAKRRCILWQLVLIGYLTPWKPRVTKPVQVIAAAPSSDTVAENPVWRFLFFLWLTGVCVTIIYTLVRHLRFRRYRRRMAISHPPLGKVRLETLPGLTSPMMTGLFRPTVCLPDRAYDEAELRLILRHELLHVERHDLWAQALLLLCRIIHWFNPILLLAANAMHRDCEAACDAALMRGQNRQTRKCYCQMILQAAAPQRTCSPVLAHHFGGAAKELRQRLQHIMDTRRQKNRRILSIAVIALILLSGTAVVVSYEPSVAETAEATTWLYDADNRQEEETATTFVAEEDSTAMTAPTSPAPPRDETSHTHPTTTVPVSSAVVSEPWEPSTTVTASQEPTTVVSAPWAPPDAVSAP